MSWLNTRFSTNLFRWHLGSSLRLSQGYSRKNAEFFPTYIYACAWGRCEIKFSVYGGRNQTCGIEPSEGLIVVHLENIQYSIDHRLLFWWFAVVVTGHLFDRLLFIEKHKYFINFLKSEDLDNIWPTALFQSQTMNSASHTSNLNAWIDFSSVFNEKISMLWYLKKTPF